MVAMGVWSFIFRLNTKLGFEISMVDIVVVFATNMLMISRSNAASVNMIEWVGMRAGFSIYEILVMALLILNLTYLIKSEGVADSNLFGSAVTENEIAISTFSLSILGQGIVNPQLNGFTDNALAVFIIHSISIVVLMTYMITVFGIDIDVPWLSEAGLTELTEILSKKRN